MRSDSDSIRDELLLMRCQRGDREALRELIRRWEGRLFYFIRQIVGQEADAWDVLQETWICALRGLKNIRDRGALAPWLYRTARNHAYSFLRKRRAYTDRFRDLPDEVEDEDGDWEASLEEAERVHYSLGRIPLPLREVLTLHYLEDLSLARIAEVAGVPLGTVKSRLHYAKRALRKELEKEDRDGA